MSRRCLGLVWLVILLACSSRAQRTGDAGAETGTTASETTSDTAETGEATATGAPPDLPGDECGEVVQITTGGSVTCVRFDDDRLKCWGCGPQVGYGVDMCLGDEPDEVQELLGYVPVGGPVAAFVLGGNHACAWGGEGVRCWGYNEWGQLGYGDLESLGDDEPASAGGLVPVGEAVLQIALDYGVTCALLANGEVKCWGGGIVVELAGEEIGDDEPASEGPIIPLSDAATRLFSGHGQICALLEDGRLECFGEDLWNGGYPVREVATGQPVRDVAIYTEEHICAVLEDQTLRCWGGYRTVNNGYMGYPGMETGYENFIPFDETPPAIEVGSKVVEVEVTENATCALLEGGAVRCFGWGPKLGRGDGCTYDDEKCWIGDDEHPASTPPVDLGGPAVALALGAVACALRADGELLCWGSSSAALGSGEVGEGLDIGDDETPAEAGPIRVCPP